MTGRRRGAWLPAVALGLAGCAETVPVAPPEISYGRDVCAVCGMIISDERFAAGLVEEGPGGRAARAFDDIGCLLQDETGREGGAAVGRWVRDFRLDRWQEVSAAFFVHSDRLHSPMAFGLAASGDRASAEKLAAEFPGEILDFQAVRRRFEANELVIVPGAPSDLPISKPGRDP